jgi:ATP-dependent Clp protease ATP-binding subunit ClpA
MLSNEVNLCLEASYREASRRRHSFLTIEHLLFALTYDRQVERILRGCGVDAQSLRTDLEQFFQKSIEILDGVIESEPVQTPAFHRALQRAILHMQSAAKNEVDTPDLLIALLTEEDSHAVFYLRKQGLSRLDVLEYVSHGSHSHDDPGENDDFDQDQKGNSKEKSFDFLEDLTEQAQKGELDPVIGREKELSRAMRVLSRRTKNNPLFLGEAGVGKTAMATAVAQLIVSGNAPKNLQVARVYSLQIGSLVAGTKFRGEFEEKLKKVIRFLRQQTVPIVFIDEIHTIVGAGATGSGSMDVANLIKPLLADGKVRVIGSTTHDEFKKSIEKDRALARRFTVVELGEPSHADAIAILKGLQSRYEEYHDVTFSDEALRSAVELSAKHISERALPDKAIDVLDEAGAANALLKDDERLARITSKEIEAVVASIARVPVRSVSSDEERLLGGLEANVARRVFGQEKAVHAVAQAIKRSRANLTGEHRPTGTFLFCGPTGVGKTELAKALASELGIHFHRFDMSEYQEKHSVARLVGAPPGYVGYEEGGQLTDLVRRHPHAVVLFDEIEKAHPDIFSILLQVLDDARLTDNQGRQADFRNCAIILTTNAGSQASGGIGFGKKPRTEASDAAVKKLFPPEFRNRLDDIIQFEPLSLSSILAIVDKFMVELEGQLLSKGITFELSTEAREWLAKEGFDTELGARPMARLIQREIKDALADEILFGKLKKGGKVLITLEANSQTSALSFTFEPLVSGGSVRKNVVEKVIL